MLLQCSGLPEAFKVLRLTVPDVPDPGELSQDSSTYDDEPMRRAAPSKKNTSSNAVDDEMMMGGTWGPGKTLKHSSGEAQSAWIRAWDSLMSQPDVGP